MSHESALSPEEFASAVELLQQLIPGEELNRRQPSGPATVYTTLVTLWMMVLQRLGGGRSQIATVKEVLAHNRALLPRNKRVREATLSETSGAYADARTRLRLDTVEFFCERVCTSLTAASPAWIEGRQAYTLDGTTVTLAPTPALRAAFPPATNQHGESVWPVALLLMAHEVVSSCALRPEVGPMYGPQAVSEAQLAHRLAQRLPRGSVILADANFGIFSVAQALTTGGCCPLLRLTAARFKALVRKGTLVEEWEGERTWRVHWTPSRKDRRANPDLPADAALDVFVHAVPVSETTLYLVTVLPLSSAQAAECYARRYDVEHDLRDVKVTLDVESIRAQSVEMFQKELLTSLAAYNLVVQFRRQAAAIARVPPRRLSFTGVWNTFQSFLLTQPPCRADEWTARYTGALQIASRDKLPHRPGRSYPRRAHPRRPKSTKFMTKPPPNQAASPHDPPKEKPK